MGTKFRTMLAPLNAPTGDGRRFSADGITLAPTPFPFEWVRERQGGHDGAVVVGVVQEANIATVAEAVKSGMMPDDIVKKCGLDPKMSAIWATGEMLDDVDREEMPRLAEDVAEVLTLIGAGTLGPSVDLDSFKGVPVKAGTDEELTWEDLEEAELAEEEVKVELLVTEGRVRAATLVSIPAFAETSRPLSLEVQEDEPDPEKQGVPDAPAEPEEDDEASAGRSVAALIASVVAPDLPVASVFDTPKLDTPTPITVDFETGRVFGHIAVWRTCHAGYADVCVTPPRDGTGAYAWFNRFPVETEDGTVWAGRLTVGGRHPGLSLTASATMAAYDGKTVAAYVRASEDSHGIVISGVLAPGLNDTTRRVLSRRKVSGDWRETPAGLSLVELLALSPGPRQHSEPGFPVATHSYRGRQTALTASFGPEPDGAPVRPPVDIVSEVRAAVKAERQREEAAGALTAALEDERQRAAADARAALAEILGGE